MNRLRAIEREGRKTNLPAFDPGDTVRVMVRVREGDKERLQAFEGICIARRGAGINATFTVRKISAGVGVERIFPLHAPSIAEIELVRKGRVRRAKLYFLRRLAGKAARIREKRGLTVPETVEKQEAREAPAPRSSARSRSGERGAESSPVSTKRAAVPWLVRWWPRPSCFLPTANSSADCATRSCYRPRSGAGSPWWCGPARWRSAWARLACGRSSSWPPAIPPTPGRATRATPLRTTSPRSRPSASRPITARASPRWCSSSSWLRPLQPLPELGQRSGVEDVSRLEPRPAREIGGVLHERQVPRLVAVRRQHEPDAVLFGGRRERVREVHALGVAVQLEQTPCCRAGATQRVEIEGVWLTLAHEAPGGEI